MPIGWPPRDLIALHLFRALLRECSYLPDPVAKEYFKKHTITRFRRHWAPKPHQVPIPPPPPERHVRLLKAARKGLGTLSRANNGRQHDLDKVLSYAYGRSGRRRRDLIDHLQTPEAPADTLVSTTANLENTASDAKQPRLTKQAEAIAKSQLSLKITREHKGPIKHVKPKIPKENAWMRPMPLIRVKNLTAKWYADTLERLLPPLPEQDHRMLQALASGKHPWAAPAFRPSPVETSMSKIVDDDVSPMRKAGRIRTIPRRKMARLWLKILSQCPTLTWNEKKSGWLVSWGSMGQQSERVLMGKRNALLFDGVDERGNIVPPSNPLKSPKP